MNIAEESKLAIRFAEKPKDFVATGGEIYQIKITARAKEYQ